MCWILEAKHNWIWFYLFRSSPYQYCLMNKIEREVENAIVWRVRLTAQIARSSARFWKVSLSKCLMQMEWPKIQFLWKPVWYQKPRLKAMPETHTPLWSQKTGAGMTQSSLLNWVHYWIHFKGMKDKQVLLVRAASPDLGFVLGCVTLLLCKILVELF